MSLSLEQPLSPDALPSDIAELREGPLQSRLAALFHRTSLSLEGSPGSPGALPSDISELREKPLPFRLALFRRTSLSLEGLALAFSWRSFIGHLPLALSWQSSIGYR